jgi:hypothetical protein
MPTATFTKFNCFVEDIAKGVHNLATDELTLALVAAANAPDLSADLDVGDLTEITYTHCSSRVLTVSSCAQTAGVLKVVIADISLTASGGSVGPFRYGVIYNSGKADQLIGELDWGSDITLSDGQSYDIDFDDSAGALTLT